MARISTITEDRRERQPAWVKKLDNGHPLYLKVGHEGQHRLGHDSYVNLLDVAPIKKDTILRRIGNLSEQEMVDVSERLIRAMEIDVSAYVEQLQPSLAGEADA